MQIAARQGPASPRVVTGPRDAAMRRARTCYDHIAGRLGVAIAQHLQAQDAVAFDGDAGQVTARCAPVLAAIGMAPAALETTAGRPVPCRPCMDWSERRAHLAGRLGRLICQHTLERGWLLRRARTLDITPAGAAALSGWLGAERWAAIVRDA